MTCQNCESPSDTTKLGLCRRCYGIRSVRDEARAKSSVARPGTVVVTSPPPPPPPVAVMPFTASFVQYQAPKPKPKPQPRPRQIPPSQTASYKREMAELDRLIASRYATMPGLRPDEL